ncbi:hypothetical protein Bpfe_031386 [Biomphalaria pfeifferi]|uniref:Uncharacterized protein n=1 Tax=Biomphalaria pfeifferi TaxID=112525 RepID=A0AAD8ETB0_BIOPF|nr:hypothetical protein Bpfe_031386 [Biomphalaria pfeifferi]
MKTETKNSSKFLSRFIKTAVFGSVAVFVAYYGLLYLFAVRYLDPEYYGSYFYAWRLEYADKQMLGMYKFVKPNEHPATQDRKDFSLKVQSEESSHLIATNYPEHFPRGFDQQFSLDNAAYKGFLEMRDNYIKATSPEANLSYADMVKQASSRKERDLKYFADSPGKSIDEIRSELFPTPGENRWEKATRTLMKIVGNILHNADGYKFDGKELGEEMTDDIMSMLTDLEMDMTKITEDHVDAFFVHLGKVCATCATPRKTFAYSRAYYAFYFLTSGIDFQGVKRPSDADKMQSYYKERMLYVAHLFARVVAHIYPNKHKVGDDAGFWKKIRNFYSPLRKVKKDVVLDSDITLLRDTIGTF